LVSLPPGSILGRYRVVEQNGRGGMATVFRALDPNLDRYIAVKVLPSYYTDDPTFVERFAQEAQTVARLRHANILQIYDFGEDKATSPAGRGKRLARPCSSGDRAPRYS